MPTAGMAAVPRSPPSTMPAAQDLATVTPGFGSGILSSSLLGRMFQTTSPRDGAQTDETDTSLYDYERGRELAYVQPCWISRCAMWLYSVCISL